MTDTSRDHAARLDAADPLASHRSRFFGADGAGAALDAPAGTPLAYFDGNSLGRPLSASITRIELFLREQWGTRLIRGWDEQWMELPFVIGDDLGRAALGAADGQTVIGDSTTVLLYKLCRAAVDAAGPDRRVIVVDRDNFPTDRYVLEGIAAERGMTLRWIDVDTSAGVTAEQVEAAVGDDTALVVLSQVAYRSGHLADVPRITEIVHAAGALVLWDLCHSAGAVPVDLDAWNVDLAVGCTYKYLNGGPGSPAFAYVRDDLQQTLAQPIQGWMGTADVFAMGPEYAPAAGIRRFISGTPPVVGMLAMRDTIALIEEVGIAAIREKSIALTEYALALSAEWLAPLGVEVASPTDAAERGGHVTLSHPAMREVTARLWADDVIPDYRDPHGLRIGLSPLSTSFDEVWLGMRAVRDTLAAL
ncbi:aminotransferase class V-fold PLP-dependent enzyme [Agromyces atrinae]|uniref:kynureninase n=1 Tax=Agromyces atrinae TaxID=592376 RepID=UPI001F56FD9E|nr:aminotransferase class V-fold PLP-dependent enzyme [Agromyces atrinae]MCI2956401.1 aminotransferase class V-fold PLP-dependent enzyme [Agromyces atrinae]